MTLAARNVAAGHIAPEVARHLDALPEICRRHHVVTLDLFGSSVSGDFDPGHSDVDVLVRFERGGNTSAFRNYFGLQEVLEALFKRSVDLAIDGTITNPFIVPRIEASRTRVFP